MRFRRGRSRRRRATWAYSDAELLTTNSAATTSYCWLLPPGRVNYLCNTDRVDSLVYKGSLLWLDFYWQNVATTAANLTDTTFYVMVAQQGETGTFPPQGAQLLPFSQPQTPSAITSWSEEDIDGTDSYLWTHHIQGMSPPNAVVAVAQPGEANYVNEIVANQGNKIYSASVDNAALVCRKFFVAAEWQPDVRIRVNRRLKKDQGIVLWMRSDTPNATNLTTNLNVRFRTLVSRGR